MNKTAIVFALAFLLASACAKETDGAHSMSNDLSRIHIPETWKVLQLQTDKVTASVRINEGLKSLKGHPALPNRIGIAMPLSQNISTEDLNSIEDFLFDMADASNKTFVIAVIITAPDFRKFVLYSHDPSDTQRIIPDLQRKYSGRQFQHYTEADPHWEGYSEFQR